MEHFKQALNYSLNDDDQKNLDDIILAYISEKESKQEKEAQLERKRVPADNQDSNHELELSDDRAYSVDDIGNPIKCWDKGRPAIKWLKACGEQKNKIDISKI